MTDRGNAKSLSDRARLVMPGRQSNFRDVPGSVPLFLSHAEDLTYTDVDGRNLIDFTLAMGAAIWGYGDEEYKDAVRSQLDILLAMSSGAAQSELEVLLAEAIIQRVPGAEWIRFGISGSEAVQLALRLGRAHTGRPLFVRFSGHYHGWMDNVAGGILSENADIPYPTHSSDDPGATNGRSPFAFEESLMLPWNDADALESALERFGEQIGVVIMEAIMCNNGCCPPKPGYLEKVRELCDKFGCVLIFDEVITGFRVAPGGAQDLLGVTPDLATFGKALAGGLPLAAIAGKQSILNQLRDNSVLGGGTFNAFQLGMAAGVVTMEKMARDDWAVYKTLDELQNRLNQGLLDIASRHGEHLLVQGPPGVSFVQFVDRDVAWSPTDLRETDHEKGLQFKQALMDTGVMIAGGNRWFISPNHTFDDIDRALEGAGTAMGALT